MPVKGPTMRKKGRMKSERFHPGSEGGGGGGGGGSVGFGATVGVCHVAPPSLLMTTPESRARDTAASCRPSAEDAMLSQPGSSQGSDLRCTQVVPPSALVNSSLGAGSPLDAGSQAAPHVP